MPHRYTCPDCVQSGAVHQTENGAEKDRTAHRNAVHGGMSPPSGDHIRYAPPSSRGLLITVGVFALLILVRQLTGVAPDDVARWIGLIH